MISLAMLLSLLVFFDRDNGQTYRVPRGQVVTVKLLVPQGASTGWEPVALDRVKLLPIGQPTFEPGDRPGTEYQVFRFLPVGPGTTTLWFRYDLPLNRTYNPTFHIYSLRLIIN